MSGLRRPPVAALLSNILDFLELLLVVVAPTLALARVSIRFTTTLRYYEYRVLEYNRVVLEYSGVYSLKNRLNFDTGSYFTSMVDFSSTTNS